VSARKILGLPVDAFASNVQDEEVTKPHALNAVLHACPDLEPCAVHCRHCGIRFLTHLRNAQRQDLRCPFGGHRFTGDGRASALAGIVVRPQSPAVESSVTPKGLLTGTLPSAAAPDLTIDLATDLTVQLDRFVLDEATLVNSPVLPYLLLIVHLLDGGRLTREELLAALRPSMRQRSIGRRPRREYVLDYLNQHPP
jgi:hypothetical protein